MKNLYVFNLCKDIPILSDFENLIMYSDTFHIE